MQNIKIILLVFLFSSNALSQWIPLNSGTTVNLNSVHFIDLQTGYAVGASGTVIKTTNSGLNWTSLNTGSNVDLFSVYFFNTTTGLSCGGNGIHGNGIILKTTNGGENWNVIKSGTDLCLYSLHFYNNTVGICSGFSRIVLYTTNGGNNWMSGTDPSELSVFRSSFMVNASTGYCVGAVWIDTEVAKSTNGGANWLHCGNIFEFFIHNDLHFFDSENGIVVSTAGGTTGGGIFRTTNGGANWFVVQYYSYGLFGVDFPVPTIGYAVGGNGYIIKSTNNGYRWSQQISGVSSTLNAVDFIDSLNGFTVGDSGTVLKTTNGGITFILKNLNESPLSYKLYQNHPNPFNPVTNIKFELPKSTQIKLTLFDVLGREVATLVKDQLSPGTYDFKWDGSNYPSGVYFYRLEAGDYVETRKMILLK